MKQRGKKSAAALSVVSELIDKRLQPPDELSPSESELWLRVVATKPDDWWDAASVPLLKEYCRLHSSAEDVAGQLKSFETEWLSGDDGLKRYERLISIRDKIQARMTQLAMKMRLTQQSRYDAQKAHSRSRPRTAAKPWENAG